MKQLGAVLLVGSGVVAVLLGLLFVVGAGGRPSRYAVGVAGLGLGGALVGFGIRWFKRAAAESPEQIATEIMALAKRKNGELTPADVRAELGERWERAVEVLAQLQRTAVCRQRRAGESVFYVFPDLQPRLTVRRCEYCEAELPLQGEIATCPHCGGHIKTQMARIAVSGDEYFGLDE